MPPVTIVKNKPMLWTARLTCIACVVLLALLCFRGVPASDGLVYNIAGLLTLGWSAATMLVLGWYYDNPPRWSRWVVSEQMRSDWTKKYLQEVGSAGKNNGKVLVGWAIVMGGLTYVCGAFHLL